MLEFNVGELASRLRRALGVRGRMPLGLDEHVIPTVHTADLAVPPWRTNPRRIQGSYIVSLGAGTLKPQINVQWQNPLTVTYGAKDVFIVTGILLQPLSVVTATGVAVSGNLAIAQYLPATTPAAASPVSLFGTEGRGPNATIAQSRV